jgi:amino acid adenylation domain-containing protein
VERIVVGLWEEVLGAKQVGVKDNFFDRGGHSLLATQLLARVQEVFQVDLPLRSFFEAPTVVGLSTQVDRAIQKGESLQRAPLLNLGHREFWPISYAQQRLWFLEQTRPKSAAYNIPLAVVLKGPLNDEVLKKSLRGVILRHESLRTVFETRQGEAVQRVLDEPDIDLSTLDLAGLNEDDAMREAVRWVTAEAAKGFDLSQRPPLRVGLLRLAAESHVLTANMHHIVSDGWSLGVLTRDFVETYAALLEARKPKLNPLSARYVDFASWQRAWLQGEILETQLAYWRTQLQDLHLLELPTDRPRPPVPSYSGDTAKFVIPERTLRQARDLAGRENVTLFMLLVAVFQLLLAKYADEQDVALGTDIANRRVRETEDIIGFFINQLVLRTRMQKDWSFRELLRNVRATTLEAYAHQDIPFEKLVEECRIERDLSRAPLFQVKLVLQNTPHQRFAIQGLTIEEIEIPQIAVKLDLQLMLQERSHGLWGYMRYSEDLFRRESVERLAEHFCRLLENAISGVEQRLGDLGLLSQVEAAQIVDEWAHAGAIHPQRCVHEFFEEQARVTPEASAAVFDASKLTYRELNNRANQLAHYLMNLGVEQEVRVGLCVNRSMEMVVGILGVLKAGGCYVPLDPKFPAEQLLYMVQDAQVAILLKQVDLAEDLISPWIQTVNLDAEWDQISQENAENPDRRATPENLAYVIYTSGSTGQPKGVAVEHRQIANYVQGIREVLDVQPGMKLAMVSTFAADLGNTMLYPSLSFGAELHLINQERSQDGADLARYFRQHQIDQVKIAPSHLKVLQGSGRGQCVLPRRRVVLGGEASAWQWVKELGESSPDCVIVNHYGPTECTVGCVTKTITPSEAVSKSGNVPLGRPLRGALAYILDSGLNPLPAGVAGELFISGEGVARGYLNQPGLTSEKFLPDPFSRLPGARMYRTGDRACWSSEGEVEFLGRLDGQVKIRGHRVELPGVEAVVRGCPGVREAVAVIREDHAGDVRLVVYVVPSGEDLTPGDLRRFVQDRLPVAMVPAAFVMLSGLPLTENGKLDHSALPKPEGRRLEHEEYVRPRTPVELNMVELWEDVLEARGIGIRDDFFELGGHSLLATQLMTRISDAFQVNVPLQKIFELRTVEGLATAVEESWAGEGRVRAPAITRVERTQFMPLSFNQERLWFLHQLMPQNPFYNMGGAFALDGPFDRAAFESSVQEIVRRQESLRTSFHMKDGRGMQSIASDASPEIRWLDLADVEEGLQQERLSAEMQQEARKPFDLARAPLLRVVVVHLESRRHVALVMMPHIVSDGWSLGVFVRELGILYRDFSLGNPSRLPELPVQYADYSAWKRSWATEDGLRPQLDYWRRSLTGMSPLNLPTDQPRPAVHGFRGLHLRRRLQRELLESVKETCRAHGVTVFMTLLAGFQLLLSRYTGQRDVATGSPIANRTRREVEGLIGCFVNALVLRTQISWSEPFEGLVKRVRETCLGAYAHQDLPFEKLVEELQPERDLSRTPLFQVVFALLNTPTRTIDLEGLTLTEMRIELGTARFDLAMFLSEDDAGLEYEVEYSTELWDTETIERLVRHWEQLLQSAVEGRGKPVGQLELLAEAERRHLLTEWNRTEREYRRDLCMHELFEQQASRSPSAIAVVTPQEQVTFAELNSRANQLAHHLISLGVHPGSHVAVHLRRSPEMIAAVLGILKAGGSYVPLEAGLPPSRISWILQSLDISAMVTQRAFAQRLDASGVAIHGLRHAVCVDDPDNGVHLASTVNPDIKIDANAVAYTIFTSGSTGTPKGAVVCHRPVINIIEWVNRTLEVNPADRVLFVASLSFDLSVYDIFGLLAAGGSIRVASEDEIQDPRLLKKILLEEPVTFWDSAPALLRQLASFLPSEAASSAALRTVFLSGDWIPVALPDRIRTVFPRARVMALGGATEATIWSNYYPVGKVDLQWPSIPYGKPTQNARYYVLDAFLNPCPVLVPGDLYIGGDCVCSGYANDPELTAEKFIPDLFSQEPGTRLYKTGDMARHKNDGNLEFLGRMDHQVKIRGYRIELGEIEVVLRQCPEVRDCVVTARNNEAGEKYLAAYIVPQEMQGVTSSRLRSYLLEQLPEYMVPSVFVEMDALPVSDNGKLDRKALPAPESRRMESEGRHCAPRTELERSMAELWSGVLGVNNVGIEDDFFDLGGHSLLATQLITRIREVFKVDLPLRKLFESPTILQMTLAVEEQWAGPAGNKPIPALEPANRSAGLPLSFAQQRLWYLEQLAPGTSAYTICAAFRVHGSLQEEVLERSFEEVVRRHESLRTVFETQGEMPVQRISGGINLKLERHNLQASDKERQEEATRKLIREELGRAFDLRVGPLFRVNLVRFSMREHVVTVAMHHVVSDGWSVGVLMREVAILYQAFSAGRESPLPELSIQYADYAVWQREWLKEEVLEELLMYWRRQLEGVKPLVLSTDYERSAEMTFGGDRRRRRLSADLARQLRRFSREQGVTVFMTLAASFQLLLSRYSGQQDITLGIPTANRTRGEIEGIIGFFINALVLRANIRWDQGFVPLLQQVKEVCLGAYAHQDAPFEKLVEVLQPERHISRNPLFQVAFALQNMPKLEIELQDLTLEEIEIEGGTSKVDMTLFVVERGESLECLLEYNTALWKAETMDRLLGHWAQLLASALADPLLPVEQLEMIPEQERRQLVEEWSQ